MTSGAAVIKHEEKLPVGTRVTVKGGRPGIIVSVNYETFEPNRKQDSKLKRRDFSIEYGISFTAKFSEIGHAKIHKWYLRHELIDVFIPKYGILGPVGFLA